MARLRSLTQRKYPNAITDAELTLLDGDSQRISFTPGLSVLSGGNGAGKSTTLASLRTSLVGDAAQTSVHDRSLPRWASAVRVSGRAGDVQWETRLDLKSMVRSGHCPIPTMFIDAASETEDFLLQLRRDPNRADLLEGVEPYSLPIEELERLAYVLRRTYDDFRVFEVSAYSEDDVPTPYFEARVGDKSYGSLEMGRGEVALAHLLWRLDRADDASLVLLEEPESHLAKFSEERLFDVLVDRIVAKSLSVVVSTHSPEFIRRLPPAMITLVSALPRPDIRSGLDTATVVRFLGLRSAAKCLLVVEDDIARAFAETILECADNELRQLVDIRAVRSGESAVRSIVGEFSHRPGELVVLGALDGDQRPSAQSAGNRGAYDAIGLLPGTQSPEQVLRGLYSRWRSGDFSSWSTSLPGGATRLRMELERVDGCDHHDWMLELSGEYGSVATLLRDGMSLLVLDEGLNGQLEEYVGWLRSTLRVS